MCDTSRMVPGEVSTGRLLSIHYLRAVAAIMVVVYHAFSHRLVIAGNEACISWLKEGVGIFFVISGFVMVVSTAGEAFSPARFVRRRITRIVPLYWFATIWFAVATGGRDWRHLLTSFFFVPRYDPSTGTGTPPIVEVGWTLNYEMAFYALFALSMLLPRRIALPALCLALALLAAAAGLLHPDPPASYYVQAYWWDFIAGMMVARLRLRAPVWCLPLGFALLAVAPQFVPLRLFAITLPAALIVASARSQDGVLRPWTVPVLLGDASYAIYLTHLFVVFPLVNSFGSSGNPAAMFVLSVFGAIGVGIGVHLTVEKPLARLVRYRAKATGKAGAALA